LHFWQSDHPHSAPPLSATHHSGDFQRSDLPNAYPIWRSVKIMRGVAANQARYASGPPAYAYTPPSIPGPWLLLSFLCRTLLPVNTEMKQFNHYHTGCSDCSKAPEGHALFQETVVVLVECPNAAPSLMPVTRFLTLTILRLFTQICNPSVCPITYSPPKPKHSTIQCTLPLSVWYAM
jgi:hypothetical protein